MHCKSITTDLDELTKIPNIDSIVPTLIDLIKQKQRMAENPIPGDTKLLINCFKVISAIYQNPYFNRERNVSLCDFS